ncbi:histidine-containing phosphotransfer protein 1-like isoform X2 [Gastrolobium bilobum]|nr:histidine-containing phosphotransfer protein 1-like isoform X2 [Gastrolobium bilobum]XP_061355088.1 histidine-containing phosphotransfer protein 1-like isoform X2 [Gastrolobium bilobum]
MAIPILQNELRCFVQSMYDEGIVNEQFFQIQYMKEMIRNDYAVRAITSYCVSCTRLFSTLSDQICQNEVDFQRVRDLASELYAISCSFGAKNVRFACVDLLHACERKDKNFCSQALNWTKNRFCHLRIKLETLVQ